MRRVPRPEGGAEIRDVQWRIPHNCDDARLMRRALDDEEADVLVFNISSHGAGMPLDVPFAVTSTTPCNVCGKYVSAWFEWGGARIWTP